MAHEKTIYWMAVGVLGLGLCNSLPRKLNSVLDVSQYSGPVVRTIVRNMYSLTRDKVQPQMSPELACARANAVAIPANLDQAFRVRDEEIKARIAAISAANCTRQRAVRIRKNMVVTISSPAVSVIPASMWNGTPRGTSE
jgi:hypothetical protein